jgi:hypothetical protein
VDFFDLPAIAALYSRIAVFFAVELGLLGIVFKKKSVFSAQEISEKVPGRKSRTDQVQLPALLLSQPLRSALE